MKKLTHEDYLQKLKEKDIIVIPLEKYIDTKTKILHKCTCGSIWKINPNSVLIGRTCGCSSEMTNEEYISVLKLKHINIEPLEKINGTHTKILHKCICGKIWSVTPNKIVQGGTCGCKKINNSKLKYDIKDKEMNCERIGEFLGANIKTSYMCSCSNIWEVTPYNVSKGLKCGCGRNNLENKVLFYKNRKTILYYIKLQHTWKIGICLFKKSLEYSIYNMRFRKDIKKGYKIDILDSKIYGDGSQAYLQEQNILFRFRNKRYFGSDMKDFVGFTELFKENILEKGLI